MYSKKIQSARSAICSLQSAWSAFCIDRLLKEVYNSAINSEDIIVSHNGVVQTVNTVENTVSIVRIWVARQELLNNVENPCSKCSDRSHISLLKWVYETTSQRMIASNFNELNLTELKFINLTELKFINLTELKFINLTELKFINLTELSILGFVQTRKTITKRGTQQWNGIIHIKIQMTILVVITPHTMTPCSTCATVDYSRQTRPAASAASLCGESVACDIGRLSNPPRETSAPSAEKFHNDDVNLVQNPDKLYDWSNEIYLIYYANPSWKNGDTGREDSVEKTVVIQLSVGHCMVVRSVYL